MLCRFWPTSAMKWQREMSTSHLVKAVHGLRGSGPDPVFEVQLAAEMRARLSGDELFETYARFSAGAGYVDTLLRRVCFRALAKKFGNGVSIGRNVSLIHPETIEIGDRVFIGDQAMIQARFDGRCVIGNGVWIGPHAYLDARDLVIEDDAGWGPGARALGSAHTGLPTDIPIIQTDLKIAPIRIKQWADVGVNAVILPGITVGRGSIVGAGAVVTKDVPDFAKVAGVPAKLIGWREEKTPVPHRRERSAHCTEG
jgi:acetyltransferase-like isoleucine patch superfamily enzyme